MYDPIIQHSFQVLEKLEKWILTVLEKCLNLTVQNSLDSGYLFWFPLIIWVFHTLILTQRDADVHTDSCGSMFTAQHFMIYLVRGQKISECIVVLSTRPTLRFLEMITCWKLLCCLFVCLWRWCCGLILLLLLFFCLWERNNWFYITFEKWFVSQISYEQRLLGVATSVPLLVYGSVAQFLPF